MESSPPCLYIEEDSVVKALVDHHVDHCIIQLINDLLTNKLVNANIEGDITKRRVFFAMFAGSRSDT